MRQGKTEAGPARYRLPLLAVAVFIGSLLLPSIYASAADFEVYDTETLTRALRDARAGDQVILLPGRYKLRRFPTRHGGEKNAPITVRAERPYSAVIEMYQVETFVVRHPYWRFEGLLIEGNDNTEHAFHIVGNADGVVIRDNRMVDFHSHIKVNGEKGAFPDQGLIEGNELFNHSPRKTRSPVHPIDIVGGEGWVIRDNVVRDFGGERDGQIAYGMFMKGNSRDGLIERNLVICSASHQGGWRLGISLGGGGTDDPYCENKDCRVEHSNGLIRNNVILRCSSAGIYIKQAVNSRIYHNTLLLTEGIDVQLAPASAIIRNNYLDGGISARKGATIEKSDNRVVGWGLVERPQAVAAYLAHRISDYHIKYPSLFNRERIQSWQASLKSAGHWLAESRLGLGHGQTLEHFPGLVLGDLEPADITLFRAATPQDLVTRDFWCNRRNPDVNYVGAIDLSVSPSDLRQKLRPDMGPSTACQEKDL